MKDLLKKSIRILKTNGGCVKYLSKMSVIKYLAVFFNHSIFLATMFFPYLRQKRFGSKEEKWRRQKSSTLDATG